jgi:hypothetical protein
VRFSKGKRRSSVGRAIRPSSTSRTGP